MNRVCWRDPTLRKGRPTFALEVHVKNNIRSNKAALRILVADDDPCVLRAVADRCLRAGFEVDTATDGLKTLIKASRNKPDILIIDVHMPEIDGLSVCAFLQDVVKQLPHVVVLTGSSGQEIAGRCLDLDATCIHKGNNFWDDLDSSLSKLCPEKADVITRFGMQTSKLEVRKRPRILLVDDDVSVKKCSSTDFEIWVQSFCTLPTPREDTGKLDASNQQLLLPTFSCRTATQNIS